MKICDLHTHSVFSDGKYTPQQLIDEAVEKNISAIALTDHNTIDGVYELLESARGKDIMAIPAVELSTVHNGKELHIVGLFIPVDALDKVTEFLKNFRVAKEENNKKTVEKLNADGYLIDYESVVSNSVSNNVTRVHIAEELVKKGYIKTIKEAFSGLLSSKGKYYTPPERLKCVDAIEFLKNIGAVSVLAHPFLDLTENEIRDFVKEMKPRGLCAMETVYSTYDEKTTEAAVKIAEDMGIKQSGGSDFHGSNKPHISLGCGMGNLYVPYDFVLELLKK